MRLLIFIVFTVLISSRLPGQDIPQAEIFDLEIIPFYQQGHPVYAAVDRLDILQEAFANVHTATRRHSPQEITKLFPTTDWLLENRVIRDTTTRKGLFNTLFKNPNLLYELRTKDFQLAINAILDFRVGKDLEQSQNVFLNKRGIELYGGLDNKIYFYSTFHESQASFLDYQENFIADYKTIRSYNNYKPYQSSILNGVNGYDYGFVQAYLGYNLSKHSSLELGHGRHFIGNGLRSLLLSDSGANYFYLKLDIQVWKLHYQCIWAELSTFSARLTPNNALLPKKYMANHYFSFKPKQNIEIGLLETVVFSRENQFELQYLNPVIFYRTVEHQLDSPDNVLLGLNFKWNVFKKFSIYSQFILDEFNFKKLTSGDQWWGNKYGLQLGLKTFDLFGIRKLDGQAELNRVRPYTYSHYIPSTDFPEISTSSYSHYNQPLAHPLGSNFTEYIFRLRYQPIQKLNLEGRFLHTKVGRNTDQNFGSDVILTNGSRVSELGVAQNQGALSTIKMIDFVASYELFSQLHFDLQITKRDDNNSLLTSYSNFYLGTGLRYNIAHSTVDY